jgi:hypothetical protein
MTFLSTSASSPSTLPGRKPPKRQDTVTWANFPSRISFSSEPDSGDTDSESLTSATDELASLCLTDQSSPITSSLELDHAEKLLELSDQEMSDDRSFISSTDQIPTFPAFEELPKKPRNEEFAGRRRHKAKRSVTLMQPKWDGQDCHYHPQDQPFNDTVVMDPSSVKPFFISAHERCTQSPTTPQYCDQTDEMTSPDVTAVSRGRDSPSTSRSKTEKSRHCTRLSISLRPLATVFTPTSSALPNNLKLQARYTVTLKNPNADRCEQSVRVTHSITRSTQHIFPDKQHYHEWQAQSDEARRGLALDDDTVEKMFDVASKLLEATHNQGKGIKLQLPNRTLSFDFGEEFA